MKKSILNKVENFKEWVERQIEDIDDSLSEREDKFYEKSEEWQNSSKGKAFMKESSDLEDDRENLSQLLSNLEDFISNS